jgi:hypothetical protein
MAKVLFVRLLIRAGLATISCALAFGQASAELPTAPTTEKCSLSGTVVDSQTGNPLPKTQIFLEPPDPSPAGSSRATTAIITTDATGAFSMVGIDPGSYRLKAQRNGYMELYSGARRPGRRRYDFHSGGRERNAEPPHRALALRCLGWNHTRQRRRSPGGDRGRHLADATGRLSAM